MSQGAKVAGGTWNILLRFLGILIGNSRVLLLYVFYSYISSVLVIENEEFVIFQHHSSVHNHKKKFISGLHYVAVFDLKIQSLGLLTSMS